MTEPSLRYAAEVVADDLELIARHNQDRYADLTGSLLGYAAILRRALAVPPPRPPHGHPRRRRDGEMSTCATSIQWLDDSPTTPCVLPKGHDGRHQYEHRYDPGTCRCVCGALDHPEWGVTA